MHFQINANTQVVRRLNALNFMFKEQFPCIKVANKFHILIARSAVKTRQEFIVDQNYRLQISLLRDEVTTKAVLELRHELVESSTIKSLGHNPARKFVRT